MKQFTMTVQQSGITTVEVDAKDEYDAKSQVEEMLENGNVDFNDDAWDTKINVDVKKTAYDEQAALQKDMQNAGFNIVACHGCGDTLIHKGDEDKSLSCPSCTISVNPEDCSDIYF